MERASELEWLKFFHSEADFGPAHGDVYEWIKQKFKDKTGKLMPEGYNFNQEGEEED